MKKILHIISSPRGAASFTISLGNAVVEKIQQAYPGSTVEEYNLIEQKFPHLEESHLNSFFTPAQKRTEEANQAIKHSNDAIAAIRKADIIVLGAPLYNFGIHSSLKAWIDHIARVGETFVYTENGPQGLITGKKVYIAMASGGIYSQEPFKANDFVSTYLTAILAFLGITDVSTFRVEGTAMPEYKDHALEKAIESIVID